ncbi:carbohydrate ABC transporter permease [Treponema brennaborense]|uniref:ABC-type transporter, integral membrane subunit n=1 Tax=Treponema brennaborense (strain DSM 12168 / CIP 105900 / DD5/3) TaxID=906968 RepID=F4LNL7_TREBD|nr:carbohydrate ABC transporter permease [Treponema brennaborense]AEE15871.1 ABC-type transporter, integral membrane subunit [Treponema brennaborense DSM 12168]
MADVRTSIGAGQKTAKFITYLVMLFFTVMAIYPLVWLAISSFKTTQEFQLTSKLALPQQWWWRNYPDAWVRGNFGMLFLNSLLYTTVSTVAIVIFSFMAGFAFAKIPNKATKPLHGSFIIGILLTLQCIMVPIFLMVSMVGLYDTRISVLVCYIGVGMPMGIYLATDYIKSIPMSLIESARIDGATYMTIFAKIIIQMAMPVGVTLAILSSTGTWNEFMLINMLASSESIKSLPVGIQKFSGALASDYGKQFAALVIGLVPMLVFYLTFRKQITKGVAAGAVKG